jgi:putative serine/threonine protein kinase
MSSMIETPTSHNEFDLSDIQDIPSYVICYPTTDQQERQRRIAELRTIGVNGVLLRGEKKIGRVHVLDKGCVSLVVLAETDNGVGVLKIRRTDANRQSMFHEANMLAFANSYKIGPRLWTCSDNFMLMEYVEGVLIADWITGVTATALEGLKPAFRSLLHQCFTMDRICLDHGELSNPSKHVILRENDNPVVIDFESASKTRKVKNLTSICQFLFINKENPKISRHHGGPEIEDLHKILRGYKRCPSEEKFRQILTTCGL